MEKENHYPYLGLGQGEGRELTGGSDVNTQSVFAVRRASFVCGIGSVMGTLGKAARTLVRAATLGGLVFTVVVPRSHAADYVVTNVNDSGAGSLRQAIIEANGSGENDVITFGVSGTIILSSQLPNIVTVGAAGTLTIQGGGSITISGNNAVRAFYVNAGGDLTVKGLTVTNGRVFSDDDGGGIYNSGSLTITDCTVSGNSAADDGGGVYNDTGAWASITSSTFSGNDAGWGGAIDSDGALGIVGSTFFANSAQWGGAIDNWATLDITGTTFSGNTASDDGGAVSNYGGGALTVTDSIFLDNTAIDDGGGIYNDSGCTADIIGSTFWGNDAGWGGGIDNDGTVTIFNCTFSVNSAQWGGAIDNWHTVTVINSTLYENSATSAGGGIYNEPGDTATLSNTIVANSPLGGNCSGLITDGGNNLDSAASCGFSTNALNNTDPELGAPTGSPEFLPLESGSPAIDAADNAVCAAPPVNNTSQNGVVRPLDGDGDGSAICDIGSYEADDLIFVDGFELGDTMAWSTSVP
ncbi:MAG: right-handed parallel beta-helix repeat-containing protein [Thermoanaerobaculales bacterium]|nr:right-handed parallel beta-helix repeat-containing protein [Thermoanaerobaculales bacterium]